MKELKYNKFVGLFLKERRGFSMLPKPSILKIPDSSFANFVGPQGCQPFSDGNRSCLSSQFMCKQYSGMNCYDAHLCTWDLGTGVVVAGAVVSGVIFVIS